ncbi:MAG: GtrA family protein [Paracoccus sp. (in: a-proteobacteria)]
MTRPDAAVGRMRRLMVTAVKFGLVGVLTLAIYALLLALVRPMVSMASVAAATAYIGSAVFNYVLQSRFTFRSTQSDRVAIGRYALMHLFCMGLNSAGMFLLVDRMGLGLWGSQVAVTLVVVATSFVLSSAWVYRA